MLTWAEVVQVLWRVLLFVHAREELDEERVLCLHASSHAQVVTCKTHTKTSEGQ
jgi:hypothetical protein